MPVTESQYVCHFLQDLQTLEKKLNCPYFYLSQFEHEFGFAFLVYFYAQIISLGKKKSHDMYFCSYSDFSVASDHLVEKMSVSHAMKMKYISCIFYC